LLVVAPPINQPRQADDVHALRLGRLEDLRARDHHAEVDDVEVVALQHDADNVLADVVHVALDGRHQHLPLGPLVGDPFLFLFDVGNQVGDGALHHARRLHHLRQEHLP